MVGDDVHLPLFLLVFLRLIFYDQLFLQHIHVFLWLVSTIFFSFPILEELRLGDVISFLLCVYCCFVVLDDLHFVSLDGLF
jgi:hypothetical protein